MGEAIVWSLFFLLLLLSSLQVEIEGLVGANTEAIIGIDDLMILDHACDAGPTAGPDTGSKYYANKIYKEGFSL